VSLRMAVTRAIPDSGPPMAREPASELRLNEEARVLTREGPFLVAEGRGSAGYGRPRGAEEVERVSRRGLTMARLSMAWGLVVALALGGCNGGLPWSGGGESSPSLDADYLGQLASVRAFPHPDPLRVCIASTLSDTGGPVRDDVREAVRDALDQWDAGLSWLRFTYVTTPDQADIAVLFAVIAADVTAARTDVTTDATGRLIQSSSVLLICQPAPFDVRLTAVHEVGRALGIDGDSPNPLDVMYSLPNLVHNPTARDLSTLTRVYQECGVLPTDQ